MHSILHSVGVRNLFSQQINSSFLFILFNAFKGTDSSDKVSSKTQIRYVTCECCFIIICLYLTFSFLVLLILCLLAKRIDLVLSSPKLMLNLLLMSQSQTFSESLFQFLWNLYVGTWDMSYWHIKIDLILQSEACCWHKQRTTMVLK